MRFLIDGYNLMHAVGYVVPRGTEAQFHSARTKFLDWLASQVNQVPKKLEVRVVFDAQHSKKNLGSSTHHGLIVQFSYRETADDVIETILHRDTNPTDMTVVSNDTRLQKAAIRHGCKLITCARLIDWFQRPSGWKDYLPTEVEPEKPVIQPDDDFEQFLKVFDNPK